MDDSNGNLIIVTANAHRIGRIDKVCQMKEAIMSEHPHIAFIQEIVISSALSVFSPLFQVFVNLEDSAISTDGVGMVTLVDKQVKIMDYKIGNDGRTLGILTRDVQFWHVYPKSGSNENKWRENYFREVLPNHMVIWKDRTPVIIQGGDHNATVRLVDSENNQAQHLQKALVSHFHILGMKDEYVRLHGDETPVSFSRITRNSKTRIDIIASNSDSCTDFYYMDIGLGFDHKMGVATFNLDIVDEREFIPKEKKFYKWAFPKDLCSDKPFIDLAKIVCENIEKEINWEEEYIEDPVNYPVFWKIFKDKITIFAKAREKEIKREEDGRKNALNAYLQVAIEDIENGEDAWEEFTRLRNELSEIWQKKAQRMMDKSKCIEIQDHVYDIHKLQKQKKYENKGKIRRLKIGETVYEGAEAVLEGIHLKMCDELSYGNKTSFADEPTEEELFFLNKLPQLDLDQDEMEGLLGTVTEDECEVIFENQVNLDSSPGIDGITYRVMWSLWGRFPSFRFLFVNYINWVRENCSIGPFENLGVMKILNKKKLSDDYVGKRKLTLVNKDANFIGKIWTNRFSKYVLRKVLPKSQFNCQHDINIIDENCEIRDCVGFLRGDSGDGTENDGTLVAIDYKNAFRSTFHRWHDLIMKGLGVPREFCDWFWAMYEGLGVIVTVNGRKSEKIDVKRGFMEGHPCSMACFVSCLIPVQVLLEESLEGMKTPDGKIHKTKSFADDGKVLLKHPEEINKVYEIIEKFEKVSGLEMHRDPNREKCQALVFGRHRQYQDWPEWVTVKEKIKIVGIWYTNIPDLSLEKINTDMVKESVFKKLFSSYGIRGTVMQKIYFVNTFILSKIWYAGQSIMLEEKVLRDIDKKIRKFIHVGENERPVQALVYRQKEFGGLGLHCPMTKSRALLVKNMLKAWKILEENDIQCVMYGDNDDLNAILNDEDKPATSADIYNLLLKQKIKRGESFIPSRSEKRNEGIKWNNTWSNLQLVKSVSPTVKYFSWCCIQDMVEVGARRHRANQNKNCEMEVLDEDTGEVEVCNTFDTLKHCLSECRASREKFAVVMRILTEFLGRDVTENQILFLSFNHRNKKILKMAVWFAVTCLHLIYTNRNMEAKILVRQVYKLLFWHQLLECWISSKPEFVELFKIVQGIFIRNIY